MIEDAIQSGEVQSSGMSSDKALSELKKAKDKLDLGLINQQEFDKLKSNLSKPYVPIKLNWIFLYNFICQKKSN